MRVFPLRHAATILESFSKPILFNKDDLAIVIGQYAGRGKAGHAGANHNTPIRPIRNQIFDAGRFLGGSDFSRLLT